MGLGLIVEVMRVIGQQRIPASVLRWLTRVRGCIALVPIIGLQDQGIFGRRLDGDERAHHRSLGGRIASGCSAQTGTGGGITKGGIPVRLLRSVRAVDGESEHLVRRQVNFILERLASVIVLNIVPPIDEADCRGRP